MATNEDIKKIAEALLNIVVNDSKNNDSKIDENKQKLAELIHDFVVCTIYGFERAYYRTKDNLGINLQDAKQCINLPAIAHEPYYNKLYKSLILRDDKYVIDSFDEMRSVFNHGYICLLNICLTISMNLHKSLQRHLFDVSSLDEYSKSVEFQLVLTKDLMIDEITKCISHTCKGDDISKNDPNEPFIKKTVKVVNL